MALSKLRTTVEILTTLEDEPHVAWELDVRNTAASIGKAITPRGLLSLVLTNAQWNAYAANISIDQNGQLVIAARYSPPRSRGSQRHDEPNCSVRRQMAKKR